MPRFWILITFLASAFSLCATFTRPVFADGEPSAYLANSGMIVPVEDKSVSILSQTIDVTMPAPAKDFDVAPAHIRVMYKIVNQFNPKPLDQMIAWPTGGQAIDYSHKLKYPINIKLDGKPVPYNFLDYSDLVKPYFDTWLARVDELLKDKPELLKEVHMLRARKANDPPALEDEKGKYFCASTTDYLAKWMELHGYLKDEDEKLDSPIFAEGLLGPLGKDTGGCSMSMQSTLRWLDPTYKDIYLVDELSERWDYYPVILDPDTEWLTNVAGNMPSPDSWFQGFGIIRFPIKLEPEKEKTLVVDYRQELSNCGRPIDFYGMVYIMEPARKWYRWEKTTIRIHVPDGWGKAVVRPKPSSVSKHKGVTTYCIEMNDRPYEDLYVSLVPPKNAHDGHK